MKIVNTPFILAKNMICCNKFDAWELCLTKRLIEKNSTDEPINVVATFFVVVYRNLTNLYYFFFHCLDV